MAGSVQAPLTSLDVELEPIQLVAPDGTPTTETRYRRDLPPETLGWLYEMMAVTRALDAEFVNLQRQGELALFASCRGQEAAQIGVGRVPAQDRLAVSAVPRDRRVPVARHHAGADGRGLAGPVARRARVHREVRRADRDPDRHPRFARGRGGDGRAAARRRLGDGRLPRRRRDERGRRPRSAQPRRRVQGAVRVLRAEQPVGDLRSGQPPAGGAVDRAPRDRLRDARHPRRRQRRAGLLRGDGRGRRTRPRGAAARR